MSISYYREGNLRERGMPKHLIPEFLHRHLMASKRYFLSYGSLDGPKKNTGHHDPEEKMQLHRSHLKIPRLFFSVHDHIQMATPILTLVIAINLPAPCFVSILTRKNNEQFTKNKPHCLKHTNFGYKETLRA
ncbi:unnamed protein product [Dovyalis caffra]|uniref:Uncharacterized protein n=1 Tax=Dovyalis caffra TaxID=77055 RepID=A0AAV1R9L5_9ROSI|nr:unnamed protein product [Dovyalis caffra]